MRKIEKLHISLLKISEFLSLKLRKGLGFELGMPVITYYLEVKCVYQLACSVAKIEDQRYGAWRVMKKVNNRIDILLETN